MRAARLPWVPLIAAAAWLLAAGLSAGGEPPAWLPRYDLEMDLDLAAGQVHARMVATWTNPTGRPTSQLAFNVHSRYVVPDSDIGIYAKTLELLRLNASEALGSSHPAFNLEGARLLALGGEQAAPRPGDLPHAWVGDTGTTLVLYLPRPVGKDERVTVVLDFRMDLPHKQGRWGQYDGVTFLTNWLPVFAVYDGHFGPPARHPDGLDVLPPLDPAWRPTPFVAWHQPFFNEAGHYAVRATLPCDQLIACTGVVAETRLLDDGRQQVRIEARAVRDFAFLCSARYRLYETRTKPTKKAPSVLIRVQAFPEHDFYAREILRITREAIEAYSEWFGPYPYPEFTIAESHFGWNGNECACLVMLDARIFGMPHLARNFVDYLVSHEVCHQWWYNAVGTNGYSETWMDEAMAVYFSHRLIDQKLGPNNELMKYPTGLRWLPNIRRNDYRSYGMYGTFARGENGPCVQDMTGFGHVANLFSLTYDKGSRVVGMIEQRLGPTAFLDFVRILYARYQFRILRVADFQRELEAYTGYSWEEFVRSWLYGSGLSDWAVDKVIVTEPACVCLKKLWRRCKEGCGPDVLPEATGQYRVVVLLSQRAEYSDPTTLGIALPGCEGYPIRIPINPQARFYHMQEPPAAFETLAPNKFRVEVLLPEKPTQVSVDPDQVLVDSEPTNNYWKPRFRHRFAPVYTFLEETDLTNAYDRWNLIYGPWIYGAAYDDAWYTRSTMIGVRAAAYRTQQFTGGVYAAYRTDIRDVVVGIDGLFSHWPGANFQVGYHAERRLESIQKGDDHALRGSLFGRYIFMYPSSLYLPTPEFLEGFVSYQDNFMPFARHRAPGGERYTSMTTAGLHYRKDYLVPYWDPEGGYRIDVAYEGGIAELERQQGVQRLSGQLAVVKGLPDLSEHLEDLPLLEHMLGPGLRWLGESRLAARVYGGIGLPTRAEFFPLGGGSRFRGYDQAERQGSAVWVASAELRFPVACGLTWDMLDHTIGLRNVYGAVFYDVGDVYSRGRAVGSVAHGVGGGLRLDVAWFSFIERTTLRLDVAKSISDNAPVQVWFGIQHPF